MEAKTLELNVNGSSTIVRRAERAVVNIDVSFMSNDTREAASGEVIKTVNNLQEMFKEHCPQTPEGIAADVSLVTF